jgi:hypothetical protein
MIWWHNFSTQYLHNILFINKERKSYHVYAILIIKLPLCKFYVKIVCDNIISLKLNSEVIKKLKKIIHSILTCTIEKLDKNEYLFKQLKAFSKISNYKKNIGHVIQSIISTIEHMSSLPTHTTTQLLVDENEIRKVKG